MLLFAHVPKAQEVFIEGRRIDDSHRPIRPISRPVGSSNEGSPIGGVTGLTRASTRACRPAFLDCGDHAARTEPVELA
ncbi:hypothetical protein TTRE_0000119801 [Trichuris trichiura]|uniref:Uncharacterized protein n=1 Tax=Trichuris trichiura TaxID=36087 RepID=A0A077YYN1_TRITR|nr:hypothetical protein TTRE_0000119801 [Trichuris trichiura]